VHLYSKLRLYFWTFLDLQCPTFEVWLCYLLVRLF
jgi:hypothetical protein